MLAGVCYLLLRGTEAAAAGIQTPQFPQEPPLPEPVTYDPRYLSKTQQMIAGKILAAAQQAGINPAFMLALAVTESSLRPTAIGDDPNNNKGLDPTDSIGLFQINLATARDYRRDITVDDLLKADTNIDLAMLEMRRLMMVYPGFALGDYAEAWTLGGRGRFVTGKRNYTKLTRMYQAIADLNLDLSLKEVAA